MVVVAQVKSVQIYGVIRMVSQVTVVAEDAEVQVTFILVAVAAEEVGSVSACLMVRLHGL